jgi:hypothetical protein
LLSIHSNNTTPMLKAKIRSRFIGLLSGNGTIGILVNGKPDNEVISINHALLYLPVKQDKIVFLFL